MFDDWYAKFLKLTSDQLIALTARIGDIEKRQEI
jgi:hypothetical protein